MTTKKVSKKEKGEKEKGKTKSALRWIIDIAIIFAFALLVHYLTNRAGYYPLHGDSYAHMTRLKFILNNWPHFNWFPQWGNGLPIFIWYGTLPFYILAIIAKLIGSIPNTLIFSPVISFALIGLGGYGLVREVTKSRIAGLIAAFLTIPLPALWYRALVGTHNRIIGGAFIMLSIWFLVKLIRGYNEDRKIRKGPLIGFTIFCTLALQSHIFPGALAILFIGVFILFLVSKWKEKIKFAFKVLIFPVLIASYFLIPFVVTQSMSEVSKGSTFGFYHVDPAILELFIHHDPLKVVIAGGGLSPIHLPLLLIFFVGFLIARNTKGKLIVNRTIISLFFLFGFFVLFGLAVYIGYPANWYNIGFVPDESFEFMAMLLPSLIAILIFYTFRHKVIRIITSLAVILLIGSWVYWQYPISQPYDWGQQGVTNYYGKEAVSLVMDKNLEERQYRFAHPTTEISLWFNYDYEIPQTREYFPQGVIYPDWKSWLENAVYEWEDNYNETNFLFDWFAVKWFMVAPFEPAKYDEREDYYERKTENLSIFEYTDPTPIISASNAPLFLVIGSDEAERSFGPILRSLSYANYSSPKVIPVRGKEYIDDYNIDDLKKYETVILYEYRFRNQKRALALLEEYVKEGGGLIIETSSFGETLEMADIENPFPITEFEVETVNQEWNFKTSQDNLFKGIDFEKFSPAIFENSPWKILTPPAQSSLREGAEIVLNTGQNPILITYPYGEGKVIWSGINLPYHITSRQNREEAKLLANMIDWVAEDKSQLLSTNDYEVVTVNPEQREITVKKPAKGVLFKENYFFNWQAHIESNGKRQKADLINAGPDMMYVFLPEDTSYPAKVIIEYKKSWVEMTWNYISAFSLIVFIIYILEGKLFRPVLPRIGKILKKPFTKFSSKAGKWWDKDEEE